MDKPKAAMHKKVASPTQPPNPRMPDFNDGSTYIPMYIGMFVIFLTLLIYMIYKTKKSSRRGILITGLCDSGKTLLYTRLVHNKFVLTQTSIKENTDEYYVNGKSVKLIDIPGHERLRVQFLDTHKSTTRGIVYVIDSQTIQKDIKDVAEFLYNILTDPVIHSNTPCILVLCNKQDQPLVKNSNAIRTMLEKEMNTLRITKSSQLESVDPNARNKKIRLGDEDKAFTFAALTHYRIDFADSFATNDDKECKIEHLEDWLARIA